MSFATLLAVSAGRNSLFKKAAARAITPSQPFCLSVVKRDVVAHVRNSTVGENMKSISLSVWVMIFVVVLISSGAYSANGMPGFEQRKADQIKRINIQIKQLEDEKACIARATKREALKHVGSRPVPHRSQGHYNQTSEQIDFERFARGDLKELSNRPDCVKTPLVGPRVRHQRFSFFGAALLSRPCRASRGETASYTVWQ